MALTDLPTDLPDGEYSIAVDSVDRTWNGDEHTTTAFTEVCAADAALTRTFSAPIDGGEFPDEPAEGGRYTARIQDSDIVDISLDWERSIRDAARSVPEDELVLPLKRSTELAPGALEMPTMATIARNKSLLVTGEPGAGKTEAIKLLLNQISADEDTPVVVFSYKDDYTDWAETRDDVVKLSTRDASHVHNIFEEIDSNGSEGEDEFDEMADVLFKEHRAGSKNIFFPDAASNLLSGLLRYLYREGKRAGLKPDNRELLDFVRRFSQEEAYELLSAEDGEGNSRYPDIQGAAGTITPKARKQTAGVYTTLQLVLERTFGAGDLSRDASNGDTISIREYMENPDGRILLLDYPIAEGSRVRPAFRFFLHRAIKFGLRDRTQAYFVLDEFARIPNVTNMEELIDTGRARNAQAILGLQSVSQLDSEYGELTADALRSGMLYELHLRSGDRRTVAYGRFRLGGGSELIKHGRTSDGADYPDQSSMGPAETAVLQDLKDGEGFLITPNGRARVRLPMYADLRQDTRRVLKTRGSARSTSAEPNRHH